MLGLRGVRLGVVYPEIYEMQVRAIVDAACELLAEGVRAVPEIMIPLVAFESELSLLRSTAQRVVRETAARRGMRLRIPIGTMVELPRAALTADEIASKANFFSFGTNDLTQTTLGLSRDDSGKFLPKYLERGLVPPIHSPSSTRAGSGSSYESASSGAGASTRASRSASAANTAASRPRSTSPTAPGSTTSRARPSASRSPASPPPTQPSATRDNDREPSRVGRDDDREASQEATGQGPEPQNDAPGTFQRNAGFHFSSRLAFARTGVRGSAKPRPHEQSPPR